VIRATLGITLPVLLLAACLPKPKTGCHTTDDCAPGRWCVSETCQAAAHDAALDASSDRQLSEDVADEDVARDRSDALGPDPAGNRDGAPDQTDPDVQATIDALEGLAAPDTDRTRQPSEDVANSPDLPGDSSGASDLATLDVDVALDTRVAAFVDASDGPIGQDGIPDGQSQTEDGAPDLPSLRADAAPDAPVTVPIDAALDLTPQAGSDGGTDAGHDEPADLPQRFVSWEDFRGRCPREPWAGGRFIVDGDLVFDEAGLQRYYDSYFAAVGTAPENLAPMGATSTWPSPDSMSLSYCISTDFGGDLATVETAMQAAATSWSDLAAVGYAYMPDQNSTCDANNANVTFDVRPASGAGYAAASFFPDSPRSARSLLVDTSAFIVGPDGVDLQAILHHQLGHTLGFQHEYLWLDPTCTSEDAALAVRIANYDIDSVMHLPACRSSEIGGTSPTEGDLVGAVTVYGLHPALIGAIMIL
jgi:hypothetical protein